MVSYKVFIPENKQSFFQEFLDMIGADYEISSDNFELSEGQKRMLDKRLKQDKNDFTSAQEALNEARKKYGL